MRRGIAGILLLTAGACGAAAQRINACGGSFPEPVYEKWFADFHTLHPEVQINYNANGSGGGVRGVTDGIVDFGASDAPMTDTELAAANKKILHFPTVMGAVVPFYNIPGVTAELQFTGPVLADIFLGKITRWNDKAIAADNPGIKLPNTEILVVRRTEASGTTFAFTDYLSKVSPEWKQRVGAGKSVSWPVGVGAPQSRGVAGLVKQTPSSIGFIELTWAIANHMTYGLVKNSEGVFVKASLESVAAAAKSTVKEMPADFRVSMTNAPGKESFPISTYTWLLIPANIPDPAKAAKIKAFLSWMLSDGQKAAAALGYAPLPESVAAKVKAQLAQVEEPASRGSQAHR